MQPGSLVGSGATAEVFVWGDESGGSPKVIKLFRAGVPIHLIESEFQNSRIVEQLTVPTPRVCGEIIESSASSEFDGRRGIVFERIDGRGMGQLALSQPWRIVFYSRFLADLHFKLHETKVSELRPLKDLLIANIDSAQSITQREKAQLSSCVRAMPDGDRSYHGDFHLDNVLHRAPEAGGPIVIDWMGAGVGDPLADVARTRVLLKFGWRRHFQLQPRWLERLGSELMSLLYTQRYLQLSGSKTSQVDQWMGLVAAAHIWELEVVESLGEARNPDHLESVLRFVRRRLAAP